MSKHHKKTSLSQGSSSGSARNFKLTYQSLSITDVNFKKQTLSGVTELTVVPLTSTGKIWKLYLNCKQCRILRITINSTLKANYSYMDPTLSVCPPESKKRNLEYFDSCHYGKVRSCDSDCMTNAGELIVKIPKDAYSSAYWEVQPIKVQIEFSLEQPKGGVRFVIPSPGTPENMKHAHVYSYAEENSSRLWFPCVDSYSELCHWDISFVVPAHMVVVSSGDLTDTVLAFDGKKKTFMYSLTIPTAAPCIGFAIGWFEVYPDPVMPEVTHFCLPGLLPILKNTVQFVNQVFGFYEEFLSSRFPYSSYKLVFVNQLCHALSSYSTLGVFDTNLLHSARVIDQVMITRKVIGLAVAKQYFGCYALPQSWSDWWLPCGIAGFLAGLFTRKMFGNTEYMHWIMTEQSRVYQYEKDHTLPPLSGNLNTIQPTDSSPSVSSMRMNIHPKLTSGCDLDILSSKAHLVIRMIQLKIGHDLLLQVFNKLLTLASTASQSKEYTTWHNLLVTTEGFMKLLVMVSGKDMSHFMEQWVCRNGVPRLFSSYSFVRKKNFIELKIKQDLPDHCNTKFVGSMNVVVQEFDGCYFHNIQIEDLVSTHELPCHSKIRKARKRKVPLLHGEEIDMDISNLDNEVPILWVRVDPDFHWIRRLSTEQSDTTWQNMLKYERDAIAQLDALEALVDYPSALTRDSYKDAVLNTCFYYHVRLMAGKKLAKFLTDTASTGSSPSFLISLYQKLFGSSSQQTILRFNDFTDIASYFLQKGLALCISGMRNMHKQCPKEVINFIMEVFKYNDNQNNKYSADYFTSGLIDAFADTITLKIAVALPVRVDFNSDPISGLTKDAQIVLQDVVQHLNIEKVLPSYKYTITSSCLICLRALQRNGHIPSNSAIFKEYAEKWNFVDVRMAALEAIVDIVQGEQNESDLNYLLDIVETDEPRIRLHVLTCLASKPPFTRRMESKLNNLPFVERLWAMMSTGFYFDSRLRSAAIQFYESLFGRLTPTCVPQGLGVVIDLKEKVAHSNLSSPITTPRTLPELKPSSLISNMTPIEEHPSVVTLASGCTNLSTSPPSSPSSPKSPIEDLLPLVNVTVLDQNILPPLPPLPSLSSSKSFMSTPPLSLKIPAAHLKRFSPSLGLDGFDNSSNTASPESIVSAGGLSDASGAVSPHHHHHHHHHHQHKRHKGDHHKEHKHKKKKKGKKSKHKHKHSSHHGDIDVETI